MSAIERIVTDAIGNVGAAWLTPKGRSAMLPDLIKSIDAVVPVPFARFLQEEVAIERHELGEWEEFLTMAVAIQCENVCALEDFAEQMSKTVVGSMLELAITGTATAGDLLDEQSQEIRAIQKQLEKQRRELDERDQQLTAKQAELDSQQALEKASTELEQKAPVPGDTASK